MAVLVTKSYKNKTFYTLVLSCDSSGLNMAGLNQDL